MCRFLIIDYARHHYSAAASCLRERSRRSASFAFSLICRQNNPFPCKIGNNNSNNNNCILVSSIITSTLDVHPEISDAARICAYNKSARLVRGAIYLDDLRNALAFSIVRKATEF